MTKTYQDFIEMKDKFDVLGQVDALATGSPVYRVVPQVVRINPNPSAGEVWKDRDGLNPRIDDEVFCLSKKGLLKMTYELESLLIPAIRNGPTAGRIDEGWSFKHRLLSFTSRVAD